MCVCVCVPSVRVGSLFHKQAITNPDYIPECVGSRPKQRDANSKALWEFGIKALRSSGGKGRPRVSIAIRQHKSKHLCVSQVCVFSGVCVPGLCFQVCVSQVCLFRCVFSGVCSQVCVSGVCLPGVCFQVCVSQVCVSGVCVFPVCVSGVCVLECACVILGVSVIVCVCLLKHTCVCRSVHVHVALSACACVSGSVCIHI